MKIEKKISKNGEITILVNGQKPDYELSQNLTGTTGEDGNGIFNAESDQGYIFFKFGKFKNSLYMPDELKETLPVEEYAEILTKRIAKVKEWVSECKATAGLVEIMDLPEAAKKLAAENKLYYRDSQGKIRRLEY